MRVCQQSCYQGFANFSNWTTLHHYFRINSEKSRRQEPCTVYSKEIALNKTIDVCSTRMTNTINDGHKRENDRENQRRGEIEEMWQREKVRESTFIKGLSKELTVKESERMKAGDCLRNVYCSKVFGHLRSQTCLLYTSLHFTTILSLLVYLNNIRYTNTYKFIL